ncbi:MAG TPA: hypothetical protein VMZ91_13935 [Candidatus Paceibacterota bacterium]|nr:hypothetical protein [Candidatus Paceibacterota bacterium]
MKKTSEEIENKKISKWYYLLGFIVIVLLMIGVWCLVSFLDEYGIIQYKRSCVSMTLNHISNYLDYQQICSTLECRDYFQKLIDADIMFLKEVCLK